MSKIKKFLFIILISGFTFSCATTAYRGYTGPRQIVAVPVFLNKSDKKLSRKFLEGLTDQFASELIKSGRFSVVERTRLSELMKEHELGMTGLMKTSDAVRIGQMVQAPYIILATISNFNVEKKDVLVEIVGYDKILFKVVLNARVISTTSGTSVGAASVIHEDTSTSFKISLDTETNYSFGGTYEKLDPAIKDQLFKAVKKLTADLYNQKF